MHSPGSARITHVVWDWNGTLLDDVSTSITVINQVLAEHRLPVLAGRAAYHEVFGFPIVDYYRKLGFDTGPDGNFDAAAHRYIELWNQHFPDARPQPGAPEVLAEIGRRGIDQVIISASEQGNLDAQVDASGLRGWFSQVLGIDDIYAGSKEHLARAWASQHEPTPGSVLLVGDTAHDVAVARAIGAQPLLIGNGHASAASLASLGVPVLSELAGVLDYLD